LFRSLTDGGTRPHTLLLESAEPGSHRRRRSLLLVSAALRITCVSDEVTVVALHRDAEALLEILHAALAGPDVTRSFRTLHIRAARVHDVPSERERLAAPSAFDVLRVIAGTIRSARSDLPESLLLAGLMSYDLAGHFEVLPDARGAGAPVPLYEFYLADQVVVVDHLRGSTELIALVTNPGNGSAFDAARSAIVSMTERVHAACRDHGLRSAGEGPAGPVPELPPHFCEAVADLDDDAFAALVRRLKRYIAQGDVFQIVASRTFSLPCPDPLDAYERLRDAEPVPYLFYLNAGEFTLFGASPESAVRVDGPTRLLEVSPIAGTCPRGLAADGTIDPDLDVRNEAALRLDPKENAEHMMLVDLARNDVARISRPGSCRVTALAQIERFGRVMHLVSRVAGELAPGLDALHACQACLNPGTLTGAPKLRAMQLLRDHEADARGHYGGAIGYLQGDGTLDTAIVIRAALVHDGIALIRAGAGIVHDSDPTREAEETRLKASAVLRAIARPTEAVAHA
ncbi:MAG TPA: anthranilate synthase component 1, partial [Gemmatimonadales bacterium]|nr:anthranilate synthase component 1 [Gemmatimonadales bacterium]